MCRPKGTKNTGIKYDEARLSLLADELDIWIKETSHFWLKDFFIERKIPHQYATKFIETSERFHRSYSLAKDIQESKIVKAAMAKKIDTTFAIFTLKNVAGWRDTPLVEINNNIDNKLVIFRNEKSNKEEFLDDKNITNSIFRASGESRTATN